MGGFDHKKKHATHATHAAQGAVPGRSSMTQNLDPSNGGGYTGTLFGSPSHWLTPPDAAAATAAVGHYADGLAPPEKFKTGNAFVDQGTACEQGQGVCFLDAGQRSKLTTLYIARVDAALSAYLAALTEVGIQTIMAEAEKSESEWMIDIFVDLVATLTSKSAVGAFKAITAKKAAEVIELEGVGIMIPPAEVASPGLAHFTEGTAMMIGKGKAAAAPKMKKAVNTEGERKKAAKVSYIDLLKDEVSMQYEKIREDALAGADDAKLCVMFDAMAAKHGHTMGAYKTAINEQLNRFMATRLMDIGTSWNKRGAGALGDPAATKKYGGSRTYEVYFAHEEEVHAFYIHTAVGRRMALYRTPAIEEPLPAKTESQRISERLRHIAKQQLEFVEMVPKEFESAAAAMHQQRWGYEPVSRPAGPQEQMQAVADQQHELAELQENPEP